ncbi:hypothetical protein [Frigoriglobus tundricola]|uniref:hypothetical protein n=1 Tax=Frigoriglobus tundricola TaxID=2774151 RepID=UPI00148ED7C2|nr:hypothetical protein [Frigoriglobus tundricola]
MARSLNRVRVAEREIDALVERQQLDRDTAKLVLDQLEARARRMQGLPPPKPTPRARAKPVPTPLPETPAPAVAAKSGPEPVAEGAVPTRPEPVAPTRKDTEPRAPASVPRSEVRAGASAERNVTPVLNDEPHTVPPGRRPPAEPPPARRRSGFLEEHNILWGELVGGLLIVGCSIALVVTLRQALEAIPYFRFLLSAGVTLGLFGAGEYTLHRWKLTGTSRGMLVIALLLAPLTLLLLTDPFTQGTTGGLDLAVKLAAVTAFVGVVRTGGRDLIGTAYLPGPVDRRWLLALAVVGTAGTQLLPAAASSAWVPLVCFVVACAATLGGLSWYHPGRRDEPIADKSGTALLLFIGLAAFALLAAWGLFLVRTPDEVAARLRALALPLALAAVPVVEAGALVVRRTRSSVGLRTTGTAVALVGFVGMTTGLALAWPDPAAVLLVAATTGAFLTRIAVREQQSWVQCGAIPLLALAAVVGLQGVLGNWSVPDSRGASDWLRANLHSPESGAGLAGFALLLGFVAEGFARKNSRHAIAYGFGAVAVGATGLLVVSTNGIEHPVTAASTHAAVAVGLLASNVRWKRRAVAQGGLWVALAGTLWALWWLAPNQPARWGFVVVLEALALAVGSVSLRGAHGAATALLRRAARDVSAAACVVAIFLAATSLTVRSEWHTGTLFALTFTGFALARLTGQPLLTWAGSALALPGFVHLGVYTLDGKPVSLAFEVAVLTQATLATVAAVACRRQARVFGAPLQWAARIATALAVPLLFVPPPEHAHLSALLAVWLGAVWLAFVLLWRERGGFALFQGAITLAALLTAFTWIEQQPWWRENVFALNDARALHAFGLALGALAIIWALARRGLRDIPRARAIWCDDPLSLDRFVLGAAVVSFFGLAVVAVGPGARAELTPLGVPAVRAHAALAHAFDATAWWLLALLAVAVSLSWRLSKLERDTDSHILGLALLLVSAPVLWAGTYTPDVATASALRWGLGAAFAAGSVAVALRVPINRGVEAVGFPMRPSPWLRVSLLALLGVAAGVVVLISAGVAEIGLSRLKPSGPREGSLFAHLGPMVSNLVPLALVVCGLTTTAGRERSSGYALAGGLVFVATLTAGHALGVVTAGRPLDGTEQTRLLLIIAGGAAAWGLGWLTVERRVPGKRALTVQVGLGLGALAVACLVPLGWALARPDLALPAAFWPLGQSGWVAFALVVASVLWHTRRVWPAAHPLVFGSAGLVAGVLIAAGLSALGLPAEWHPFHALAVVWAAVGFAFCTQLRRGGFGPVVLIIFAGLLVICALRGGWDDPWRPWLPGGLALSAAVYLGGIARHTRLPGFAVASGLSVNLAAVLVWIAWGPDTVSGFLLANAAGLAVATLCWTLVKIRASDRREDADWLERAAAGMTPAIACLVLGLAPSFAALQPAPGALTWGALGAVALACAVALWDRSARLARPALYGAGVLAVLLGAVDADDRPVWNVPAASLVLSVFVLGAAGFALAVSRRTKPLLGIPERGDGWPWLPGVQALVAGAGLLVGLRTGLIAPTVWERLGSPAGGLLLAVAFAVLARAVPKPIRDRLRKCSVGLAVFALGAVAWAVPEPVDRYAWLHRNGWLFVLLTVAAVGGTETAPHLGARWRWAVRDVMGWAAVAALAVLCVHLIQQVPVFDPNVRRTPLTREAALAMLVATAALFVLALRFALKPDRDPFALRPARRTVYVYLAEALIVLFFAQIRFNVPELFRGELAKMWTFAVMALAYTGIGLAELFERKKIDVLALPLRRTGVLLPLVPLLAFWAKPPAFVSEFAQTTAPGLGPLLSYLEKLPQHFDTYAWLWFLAGGVYGLVALAKNSFGWALLAALATNAAMWSLLTHHEVPFVVHPQAWVIPLALIVLGAEHINRRRLSEGASNAMRYAGVSMIYVSSAADMFLAGVGNSMWLPVVLAVLCVGGVLAGILLRVRAFVHLGVGFLLLDLFSMIWYAAVDLQQTWVWYVSGIVLGVVVLALFAYLEKRRTHDARGAGTE